jgi:putative MATE family efflux protein
MNDRKHELAHENLTRLIIRYSTPATVAMVVNSLYNVVDTIFIGKGAGTMALAGLAVSHPVQMVMMGIALTIGMGSASIISRCLGEGNQEKAEEVAGSSFMTTALTGFIMMIFGFLFIEPLLNLFGATDQIMPYGKAYLSILLFGTVFFSVGVSSNNIIRAEGNARMSMNVMLIGAISNIILDPIFIFGFRMGIKGAALATVISQFASFTYIIWYFCSGKSMLKIKRHHLKVNFKLLPEVLSIGLPSLARLCSGSLIAVVMNNTIIQYGNETHLAIISVISRLIMFLLLPIFGIAQGLQPIIGFNYGAKNLNRVRESLKLGVVGATAFSFLGFIVLRFLPEPILGLFTDSTQLVAEAIPMLNIIVFAMPLIGVQMLGGGLFQAIGKAKPALFLSLTRQVIFMIPLILILPKYFQLKGIMYSFPISDILSFTITFFMMSRELTHLGKLSGETGKNLTSFTPSEIVAP